MPVTKLSERWLKTVLQYEKWYQGDEAWRPKQLWDWWESNHTQGLIAFEKSAPNISVGYMLVTARKRRITINRLWVHPDFRRQGYATELLEPLLKMTQEGNHSVNMIVNETDDATISLLKQHGFRAMTVLWNEFGDRDGYLFNWEADEDAETQLDATGHSESGRAEERSLGAEA